MKIVLYCTFLFFLSVQTNTCFAQQDEPPLIEAVVSNDLNKIKQLVAAKEPLDLTNTWGETALDVAIAKNLLEIVRYLLSQNAPGRIALEDAARHNNMDLLKLLIAQKNYTTGDAMVYACENNNFEMARILIDAGAKVDISQKRKSGLFSKYYVSPIEFAVKQGNQPLVLLLLENGAPYEEAVTEAFSTDHEALMKALIDRSPSNEKHLTTAVLMNKRSIVEYLVGKGVDPRKADENGNTLIHLAASVGNEDMVHYCVEVLGLDLFAVNFKKETALMLAVRSNKEPLVSYLLNKGAHANSLNDAGENALFYITDNNLNLFEILVHNGAEVSIHTTSNSTLLIDASKSKNFSIVRFLLDKGADIMAKDDFGHTAFQYLISPYDRNEELIRLFLDKGADINTVDAEAGKSMMYYAIESESLPRITRLKELGASLNVLDKKGYRPTVDEADIIVYLIENGAEINALDSRDNTYLCVAIGSEDLELAHFLVNKGIDVNKGCYFSETPLIKAVKEQNLTLVRFLAENGADINAVGYFQKNVMEYAKEDGTPEIIAYLESRGAMTKQDRNELYRASMEMESEIRTAIAMKNEAELASLIKKSGQLIVQDRIVDQTASFAAEMGNLLLIELLIEHLKLDVNAKVNEFNQNMLMIATIHNKTTLVSYLLQKNCKTDLFDLNGKKAQDYANTKEMKRIYKDAGL